MGLPDGALTTASAMASGTMNSSRSSCHFLLRGGATLDWAHPAVNLTPKMHRPTPGPGQVSPPGLSGVTADTIPFCCLAGS